MNMPSLCPFCFEPMTGTGPCPNCGHQIGELVQGLQQLPVGWILDGKYRIGMTLGQGGFGITYLAYDMMLQSKAAIKEYFPGGLATRNSQYVTPYTQSGQLLYSKGVESFYREAQMLARFNQHPNVVHISNFFRENNTAYFVMEYVEGESLAQILDKKGGKLTWKELEPIIIPVLDVLEVLHQAGILHRDIAPDNIYVTENGTVKLLDFGAAKNELSQHTHSSAAILKPGYAPLEQYSVTGNQGPWTDVYAMGAVIYHCLTGTIPPEAPDRITGQAVPPLSTYKIKCSKHFEETIMKALALDIDNRWLNVTEFEGSLIDKNRKVDLKKEDVVKVQKKKISKRKVDRRIIILLSIIILSIITGTTFFILKQKEIQRQQQIAAEYALEKGIEAMANLEYEKAIEYLKPLGEYRDADEILQKCSELYTAAENDYQSAAELLESGKYEEAIELFKGLDGYKDADDLIIEGTYQYALYLTDKNQYKDAIPLFDMVITYKDAADRRTQAIYDYGCKLIKDKKYDEGIKQLKLIPAYKDSDSKIKQAEVDKENQRKYDYITKHKNNQDRTTLKYLEELIAINYKDTSTIYKTLYTWGYKIVVNQSESNTTTNRTSIDKWHKWYFHVIISGGKPGESVHLTYKVTHPSGDIDYGSFEGALTSNNKPYRSYWYEHPAFGTSGYSTFELLDSSGTKQLAKSTVYIGSK